MAKASEAKRSEAILDITVCQIQDGHAGDFVSQLVVSVCLHVHEARTSEWARKHVDVFLLCLSKPH